MGRDSGDSARLLDRLSRVPRRGSAPGWSDGDGAATGEPATSREDIDPFPAGSGGGDGRIGDGPGGDGHAGHDGLHGSPRARGRHVDGEPGRTGWRVSGVPPGPAVLLLVVAVVGVLLLGRGSGSEEVLVTSGGVGVATVTGPSADGTADPADDPDVELSGETTEMATGQQDPPVVAPSVPSAGPLLVHVDGAVQRPGVVELPPGSRVGDAVQAAGGATDEADTRLVNLARLLTDGELVVVPRPGEPVTAPDVAGPGPAAGTSGGAGPVTGAGGATAAGGPVDLNTADAAALDELPGIGPVLAERIVTWREESGPFTAVDDLTAVSGIGPAVLADVRDLVTV